MGGAGGGGVCAWGWEPSFIKVIKNLVLQKCEQNRNRCTIHIAFDSSSPIVYYHDMYLH